MKLCGHIRWRVMDPPKRLILPIRTKSSKFGKWSPNWEGPHRINRSAPGNAYILETLEAVEFLRALNGKYLKRYYPSI